MPSGLQQTTLTPKLFLYHTIPFLGGVRALNGSEIGRTPQRDRSITTMVKTTWTPNYIDNDFFESAPKQKCKIAAAYPVTSEKTGKTELQIEVVNDKQHKKMSIWGENHRFLIQTYGDETDNWIGKTINIEQRKKGDGYFKVLSI